MELRNFIKTNSSLINKENYEKLYRIASLQLSDIDIGNLTNLLYYTGQNPLLHVTSIPHEYFYGMTAGVLNIPGNILNISNYAFTNSRFQFVHIPKSVRAFGLKSFYNSSIKYVTYAGSFKDFKEIAEYQSIKMAGIEKIECDDGIKML